MKNPPFGFVLGIMVCTSIGIAGAGLCPETDEFFEKFTLPIDWDGMWGSNFSSRFDSRDGGSIPTDSEVRYNLSTQQPFIDQPQAILYTKENFAGLADRYVCGSHNRGNDYRGRCYTSTNREYIYYTLITWKSVKTFGTCIRLFTLEDCHGSSVAIYPGSIANPQNIVIGGQQGARSIGPCLENEFKFASIKKQNETTFFVKDRQNYLQIPDRLNSMPFLPEVLERNLEPEFGETTLVKHIIREGPQNRTKYIMAEFGADNVCLESTLEETIIEDKEDFWKRYDKLEGDDLGFFIPPKLGGPTDNTYNIFPQSPENAKKWTRITDRIFEALILRPFRTVGEVISLTPFYKNQDTLRPFGFYYYTSVLMTYEGPRIDYGFLYN